MMLKRICTDDTSMRFVRSLKTERQRMGLSQSQLAGLLEVNRTLIIFYENGKALPSLHNLIRLAEIFGYDLSESVNYKVYHKKIHRYTLKKLMMRYGLTCKEIAELTGYDRSMVLRSVNMSRSMSLDCLSAVLELIMREQEAYSFRKKLCRKTATKSTLKSCKNWRQ